MTGGFRSTCEVSYLSLHQGARSSVKSIHIGYRLSFQSTNYYPSRIRNPADNSILSIRSKDARPRVALEVTTLCFHV